MIVKLSYTLLIFCCLKAILFPIETSSKEVKDGSFQWTILRQEIKVSKTNAVDA